MSKSKSIEQVKRIKIPTTTVAFRVPTSKAKSFKILVEPLKKMMRDGEVSKKVYLETIIESLKLFLNDTDFDKSVNK